MKSWTPPTNAMIEALASVKKETDRQYFFSKLKNPLWIVPLRERGYFNNPPGMKQLPDGYVQFPNWPELSYLVAVAEEATDQVVEIILSLPRTNNPRVYDNILDIALKLEPKESAKLLPKLIEYIELGGPLLAHRYPELLQLWVGQGNFDEALAIAKLLIPFRSDPKAREKQQLRKKTGNTPATLLDPAPIFSEWEYQQILEKGIRPLSEHEPYRTTLLLIDAVESMIRLQLYAKEYKNGGGEDYSEIWCPRLHKSDRDYPESKELLMQALAYACEQVYDKAQNFIDTLDQALRDHHWKVFERLRQYLYALHPTDRTLPWIREQILKHDDYSKWEHHYEFQLMIRKASESFGPNLLSVEESKEIFDAILSGPSEEDFREWMGDRYSEELFQKRQRYFHRLQLRPFATLLSGEIRRYFDDLEGGDQTEAVTDDSYSPYGGVTSGYVSYRSPKSVEDLESLPDEELLTYLNEWSSEHRVKDGGFVEVSISALADVFQSLCKEKILQDGKRWSYWIENCGRIARPIYVAAMLRAMREIVKEKNFSSIEPWLKFCGWVLSHPNTGPAENQPEPREESRDHPDWGSSRRAVIDFIDACVDKDTNAPAAMRAALADLLQLACNQIDWRLDHDHPVLLNRDDPITEAINNARGRALESLINFGFWIRRHSPDDKVAEVTDILSKRITDDATIPLTQPEYALLGVHFGNLSMFNQNWTIEHREIFFPRQNEAVWSAAFGSYLRFNRPFKSTFEILKHEFAYAVENLNALEANQNTDKNLVGRLGQHLFTYYLWEAYPLTGDDSLLERFYEKTNNDRKHWAQLFKHVGFSLRDSGKHLDKMLIDRAVAFFGWRFDAAEPLELHEFAFWLEAECLNPEWRLQSYSKILDLGHGKDIGLSLQVRALNKLLPNYLRLVVECFTKITNNMDQNTQTYILADEAKPILKAGLNAEDLEVRENAECARENLLRLGRFDYLDLE